MFLALPSNSFSPWAVHRSIRKSLSPACRSSWGRTRLKGVFVTPRSEAEGLPELVQQSSGKSLRDFREQQSFSGMLQPPLPSAADPAVLAREWELAFWGGQQDKDKIVRVCGIAWDILSLKRVTKNNQVWPGEQICLPWQLYPASCSFWKGMRGSNHPSRKQNAAGIFCTCGANPTSWPLQLKIFNHGGIIQFDMKGIYHRKLLLGWKLRFQEDPAQELLTDFPFLGFRQKMKFSVSCSLGNQRYHLCILSWTDAALQQPHFEFLNSNHQQLSKLQACNKSKHFLPSLSLGNWNHTGSSLAKQFLLQLLTDFCFQLYFIILLPILTWFLTGLRAPNLQIGLAFPLELQGLLRHSAHLWQVHFFAAQSSRTCFVSGLAQERLSGWHYSQLTAGTGNSAVLPPGFTISYSSSKLCQEKDCSSMDLLSFADKEGWQEIINMLTLRHQMCGELLQRLWFIYFILNMKFFFHLNQTQDSHQLLD